MTAIDTVPARDSTYARGVALVLAAGVFWSVAGLVMRLLEDATEWQVLFYRSLALVATLLTFIASRSGGAVLATFRAAGAPALVAGLFLGTGFACWIFAMTHTTIANALFVLAAAPFFAALIARLTLGESVRRVTVLCMGVSAVGIAVMVGEGVAVGTLAGNLFALGAALAFGCFSVTLRWGKSVDMTPAVCWAGVWAGVLAAAMIAAGESGFRVSAHDLELCGLLGFAQVGVGLILFTIGSRYLPAAEITLLSLTEVVLGPLWVWLGVGEAPSALTLLGGAIVLAAITTQAMSGVRRRRPPVGVV